MPAAKCASRARVGRCHVTSIDVDDLGDYPGHELHKAPNKPRAGVWDLPTILALRLRLLPD